MTSVCSFYVRSPMFVPLFSLYDVFCYFHIHVYIERRLVKGSSRLSLPTVALAFITKGQVWNVHEPVVCFDLNLKEGEINVGFQAYMA